MDMEVVGMARLKSKWLSEDQIRVVKGFGRRFRMIQRSGIIRNNVSETEDAGYGYTYSPPSLIKEIEEVAEEMEERGLEVYISANETGVEVAGMYPGTWDGEFQRWDMEEEE
jgi:diphthamide synthase subunit DPH2